ncbi:ABC transporter substrate-binding protein [Nocardia sp. IBHARD005]|uniref:ABC transporter substrate-binding protein n=1 Tax=Nocardia sp. IBHARD005 TaxID=3457765 RepID=UPI0040591B1C
MSAALRRPRGAYRRSVRVAALPVLAALLLSVGCSSVDEETGAGSTGPGVTKEPCPNAIDKAKGCIYLGALSDLEGGPFAVIGQAVNAGQTDFWRKVNESGGIGGKYEVDLATNTKNTSYDAQKHAAGYKEIEPKILALALSLGTVQTQAILDDMDSDNVVAAAGTFWSGWQFPETDKGLVLESGYSYCTEAVIGLDWLAANKSKPTKLASVGFPGDYGGDYAEGVKRWADANGAQVVATIKTAPNQVAGNQDGPVQQIVSAAPDVVTLATGPAETAEIIGKAVAAGYKGRFIGAGPTWNGALLKTPAAPALKALYNSTSPFDGWDGTSAGIAEAKAATAGKVPSNWAYIAGWAISKPIKQILDIAAEQDKLNRVDIRKLANSLEANFDGLAPNQVYGKAPVAKSFTGSIAVPDDSAPMGTKTVEANYKAPTLEKIKYDSPCVMP